MSSRLAKLVHLTSVPQRVLGAVLDKYTFGPSDPGGTSVAQVESIAFGGNADGTYTATINGVDYSFVAAGSTLAQIINGLVAAAAADPAVTASNVTNTVLRFTAKQPGVPFTIARTTTGSSMTITHTTASSIYRFAVVPGLVERPNVDLQLGLASGGTHTNVTLSAEGSHDGAQWMGIQYSARGPAALVLDPIGITVPVAYAVAGFSLRVNAQFPFYRIGAAGDAAAGGSGLLGAVFSRDN